MILKENLRKNLPFTMDVEENMAKKPEPVTFLSDLNLAQRCLPLEKRSPRGLLPHNIANKRSLLRFPSLISKKSHEQAFPVPILPHLCMDIKDSFSLIRVLGGDVIFQTQSMLSG